MKQYFKPKLEVEQYCLFDDIILSSDKISLNDDVFDWEGVTERW